MSVGVWLRSAQRLENKKSSLSLFSSHDCLFLKHIYQAPISLSYMLHFFQFPPWWICLLSNLSTDLVVTPCLKSAVDFVWSWRLWGKALGTQRFLPIHQIIVLYSYGILVCGPNNQMTFIPGATLKQCLWPQTNHSYSSPVIAKYRQCSSCNRLLMKLQQCHACI